MAMHQRKLSIMYAYEKPNFLKVMTLRSQTVHSVHCTRILQQAKIRFVVESATFVLFFDLFCCFGFHKQIIKTYNRSKLLQKLANLRNP